MEKGSVVERSGGRSTTRGLLTMFLNGVAHRHFLFVRTVGTQLIHGIRPGVDVQKRCVGLGHFQSNAFFPFRRQRFERHDDAFSQDGFQRGRASFVSIIHPLKRE